ncbi:MAG: HU family DNA-binding protein [Myxococcales bacterium]|nr:HU family DNA-binding protein [Myxococcales bacterium]MCB9736740.1 HU family DNA-binding protein [Deltaproteobacteria bacterium]
MNKTELVKAVAEESGLAQRVVAQVLDALFDERAGAIPRALGRGEAVAIRGFGTFEARERGPRLARNPGTGAPVQLPAERRPAWRPAPGLKRRIND